MGSLPVTEDIPGVPRADQIAGCLLGQSLADALAIFLRGCSVEAAGAGVDGVISSWLAGDLLDELPDHLFITEGSQLSWEIILLYTEQHEFLPDMFAAKIREKFDRRFVQERYWETHLAVKNLRSGQAWFDAGVDSLGCGSIHRAPAIGVIGWNDRQRLRIAAEQQSRITHSHEIASAASMLIAELVADTLCRTCGPEDNHLALAVPENASGLGAIVDELPEILSKEPMEVLSTLGAEAEAGDGIGDHIRQGMLWALYCTLRCKWDFVDAVTLALRCGGESVAPVALVGALCGAAQGVAVLPEHLLSHLTDRGFFRQAEFLERCQKCYEVSTANDRS